MGWLLSHLWAIKPENRLAPTDSATFNPRKLLHCFIRSCVQTMGVGNPTNARVYVKTELPFLDDQAPKLI
jgi:hypothetical protein